MNDEECVPERNFFRITEFFIITEPGIRKTLPLQTEPNFAEMRQCIEKIFEYHDAKVRIFFNI